MHELGITQNIVAIAAEYAAGAKVHRVTIEIGKLTAILPDAVRFCFEVCCQGTSLEGAVLEIIETPGIGCCLDCGAEVQLNQPFGTCTCGSHSLEILQGQELKIKTLETEELCV